MCMCVYVYIYILCIHTDMLYVYIYTHICICICICICISICVYIYMFWSKRDGCWAQASMSCNASNPISLRAGLLNASRCRVLRFGSRVWGPSVGFWGLPNTFRHCAGLQKTRRGWAPWEPPGARGHLERGSRNLGRLDDLRGWGWFGLAEDSGLTVWSLKFRA